MLKLLKYISAARWTPFSKKDKQTVHKYFRNTILATFIDQTTMTVIYKLYSFIVLLSLHFFNFLISKRFIRPKLIPLLFTTNETKLTASINSHIHEIESDYKIPIDYVKQIYVNDEQKNRPLFEHRILEAFIDIIISFSIQLIGLFLFEIIHVIDFEIRHFDWYITLCLLLVGLTYIIPTLIIYFWIFKADKVKEVDQCKNIKQFTITFALWCAIVYGTTQLTFLKDIEGNIIQISLYLISLFGISCLSVLNGIGCLMGCVECFNWYTGKEYNERISKEFRATEVVRSMDSALKKGGTILRHKLSLLDSLLRDVTLLKQYRIGMYFWIRCGSWTYCIYKIIHGAIRIVQLTIDLILAKNKRVHQNHYHGSGDFLSATMAKIIIAMLFDDADNASDYMVEQITMGINFVISISFFFFSINHVLFTIKNLKALSKKSGFINSSNQINFDKIVGDYLFEIYNLVIVQISGVYVVSTALLLNSTNMPFHCKEFVFHREDWENDRLKSTVSNLINADFINEWFDAWFFVGCSLTVMTLVMLNKNKTETHYKTDSYIDVEEIDV